VLGKLLKYDFRALNRIMLPLQGGVLLASIVGCILLRLGMEGFANSTSSSMYSYDSASAFPLTEMLSLASTMMAWGLLTLAYASFWVTLFLAGKHYHQSFHRDEGYLTFTLPVTATQNLLSKTVSGSTWLLINMLILMLAAFLVPSFGFVEEGFSYIIGAVNEAYTFMGNAFGAIVALELIVLCLLGVLTSLLQVYLSLTIGAVIAKTHKVLAGIGIYIAIYVVIQIIVWIALSFFVFLMAEFFTQSSFEESWFSIAQLIILPTLAFLAAFVTGSFFYTKHLIENKLNLD